MKIFYSPLVQQHDPEMYFQMGYFEKYPEKASRAESVVMAADKRGWKINTDINDFGMDPILNVHSKEYCEYFKNAYDQWVENGGNPNGLIPDTFPIHKTALLKDLVNGNSSLFFKNGYYSFDTAAVVTKKTFEAAYEAVQVTLTAAESLLNSKENGVFALVRPPGHHSGSEFLGGFCFFNNIAVAAQYLIDKYHAKVCILDVDYHHGNGTQTIFYEKSNPMFVSLHGQGDYPFYWGYKKEIGEKEGIGYNVNIPLPLGTEDHIYLSELENAIKSHIIPYQPTVLLISLGVDTARVDPVGGFALSENAFSKIGKLIREANVPTLFVFEGGYAVSELGDNVCNVLSGFQL